MGLGIDWAVLFAPIIAKIVEKLVEEVLKWIAELDSSKRKIDVLAVLCDQVMIIEAADDKDKRAAVDEFIVWARGVVA